MANWPAMRPDLHHRHPGAVGEHDRHLQDDAELVADVVGAEVVEALGAIAGLEQKRPPGRDLGQGGGEVAGLPGEHQRRKAGQLFERLVEGGLIGPGRLLIGRMVAPGRR